ncbi:MAG: DUF72 domain-containing protein [Vicinamibacterales bacterium]
MELLHRHVGLALPSGRGTERHLLPSARGPPPWLRRARLLRRAVQQRRDQQHLLSASRVCGRSLGWSGGRPGLRVLGEAVPVHAFSHGADRTAITQADIDAFRAGIDPLAAAGRLGALLVQFPSRFHESEAARTYLDWLLGTFAAYPLAVELRHRSWSDAGGEARALARHRATWVQIDEPKFASSVRQDLTPDGPLMYVRLHGRNAAEWWDHAEAEDRYNYLYGPGELAPPIVEKLRAPRAHRSGSLPT